MSDPCQISQTHMLHRCNLIAIVGTGPGAKFFNDKGDDIFVFGHSLLIIREVNNKLLGRQANFEYSPSHSLDTALICRTLFLYLIQHYLQIKNSK